MRRSEADTHLIAIAFASGAFTRHIARRSANDTLMTLHRQLRDTTGPLYGRLDRNDWSIARPLAAGGSLTF
jgi:hypothetical protein